MAFEEINVAPGTPGQRNEVAVSGDLQASRPQTVLHLPTGRTVTLPTELLLEGMLPAPAAGMATDADLGASSGVATREAVIPVVAEQAVVGKKTVATGTVRLHRGTETSTETVSLPLTHTSWEVERTPVGQLLPERPEVRQEGDTMIYPLVEERLVARKEYFLLEEVRVRRVSVTTERSTNVELRRDVLTVERDV